MRKSTGLLFLTLIATMLSITSYSKTLDNKILLPQQKEAQAKRDTTPNIDTTVAIVIPLNAFRAILKAIDENAFDSKAESLRYKDFLLKNTRLVPFQDSIKALEPKKPKLKNP